ncbi:14501_t:CDS:1, partial [Gigaspora rosea]
MGGEYICQYRSNEGGVCGQACRRQEGCRIHWKRRQRIPCKQCGRSTASTYGLCNMHVNKCHSNAYYHQKKLDNMLQDRQTPEAM